VRSRTGSIASAVLAGLLLVGVVAGCGSDDDSSSTATTSGDPGASGDTRELTIGYSAWPGWFPLAVADEEGIFEKNGLDVDLKYFTDYTASLDALSANQLDVNAQTLNDTIFAVAAGSKQKVVVVGDNSTGNDAVICDESVKDCKELEGKSIGAEEGVVDHFLLLQGLAEDGMTQDDIDFSGIKTDAAAASFASGKFDCVAVFAPFTLQALERDGSHVVLSSKDLPGVIPDHLVASEDAAKDPEAMQKLVDAWYETLDWIDANPDEATEIMAKKAGTSVDEYESFAEGTTLFSADDAVNAFEDRADDTTSLPEMARRINPFLVESGLTEEEADLTGLFEPQYTEKVADGGS
jgi:NitT/TauT family transport system substrate-binding protein